MSTKLELMLKESIKQTLLEKPELLQELPPIPKPLAKAFDALGNPKGVAAVAKGHGAKISAKIGGGGTVKAVARQSWGQMMRAEIRTRLRNWAWTTGPKGLSAFGKLVGMSAGGLIAFGEGFVRFLPITKLTRPAKAAVKDIEGKVVKASVTAAERGAEATSRKNWAWATGTAGWELYLTLMKNKLPWESEEEALEARKMYEYVLKAYDPIEWVKYWATWAISKPDALQAMQDFSVPDKEYYTLRAEQLAKQLTTVGSCLKAATPKAKSSFERAEGEWYNPNMDPHEKRHAKQNWESACTKRLKDRLQAESIKLGSDMEFHATTGERAPTSGRVGPAVNPRKPEYSIINTALDSNDREFHCVTSEGTPMEGAALQTCNNTLKEYGQHQDRLIFTVCDPENDLRRCNNDLDPMTGRPRGYSELGATEKAWFDLFVYGILDPILQSQGLAPTTPATPPTELAGAETETEPSPEPV